MVQNDNRVIYIIIRSTLGATMTSINNILLDNLGVKVILLLPLILTDVQKQQCVEWYIGWYLQNNFQCHKSI
jgi:hypothetical protein